MMCCCGLIYNGMILKSALVHRSEQLQPTGKLHEKKELAKSPIENQHETANEKMTVRNENISNRKICKRDC